MAARTDPHRDIRFCSSGRLRRLLIAPRVLSEHLIRGLDSANVILGEWVG